MFCDASNNVTVNILRPSDIGEGIKIVSNNLLVEENILWSWSNNTNKLIRLLRLKKSFPRTRKFLGESQSKLKPQINIEENTNQKQFLDVKVKILNEAKPEKSERTLSA